MGRAASQSKSGSASHRQQEVGHEEQQVPMAVDRITGSHALARLWFMNRVGRPG
ncbi:Mycobacterium terramassiliense ORFan [Mycobacterium terramassiliense]|uniref:Mycobacterium terramassiliense ORFan n=1 Tax=Mycobacterium terramassiliense TaxID=1841859 RepID=A0A2U3NAY2_9MYCO|nr:Mycobacterium terramassiliense ORFan [Mycobacterium terramassiliense]